MRSGARCRWLLLVLIASALSEILLPRQGCSQEVIPIVDLGEEVITTDSFNGALIGGARGGRWLSAPETAALLKGGESYRLYSPAGEAGTATGSVPQQQGNPHPDYLLTLQPVPANQADLVAVGRPGNTLPRVPQKVAGNQEVYRRAVARILKSKGIVRPKVQITQVLRVDLDGDGMAEELVSATRFQEGVRAGVSIRTGDYSLVLLRRLVQGKWQDQVLEGEFFPKGKQAPLATAFRIYGCLDLDGDGAMEVLVRYKYYEGAGLLVYQLQGNRVKKVLQSGWGA